MNKKEIILEQKTLSMNHLGSIRCVLLQEHRPLKETECIKALEWLKGQLIRAVDKEAEDLMDVVIRIKKQMAHIGTPLSFDIKTHWYAAIDICKHLDIPCHRKFFKKQLRHDMLKKAMIQCSDGKRHTALLVNTEGVDRLIDACRPGALTRRNTGFKNEEYTREIYSLTEDEQGADNGVVKVLSKALEQETAKNEALAGKLLLLQDENRHLKRKADLFEDIRSVVEGSA
ncbi:hypothetical protein [Eubacterium callanderi]|nr:hypothetical protein [Eubacterium sp.]